MSEHTPGPWLTVRDNEAALAFPGSQAFAARVVWAEPLGDVAYVIAEGDNDHGNANARLIAAAPALLEAGKRAVAKGRRLWDDAGGEASNLWAEFEALDDAIAQAEGRDA